MVEALGSIPLFLVCLLIWFPINYGVSGALKNSPFKDKVASKPVALGLSAVWLLVSLAGVIGFLKWIALTSTLNFASGFTVSTMPGLMIIGFYASCAYTFSQFLQKIEEPKSAMVPIEEDKS